MTDTLTLSERFKTNADIIKDPYFIKFLTDEIKELKDKRRFRQGPGKGKYYKRDWYDKMSDQKMLSIEFFLKSITDIWEKKSLLSSEIRSCIQYICDKALRQMVYVYGKEEKVETV